MSSVPNYTPSGGTIGPVRLTWVALALVLLDVSGLVGYVVFLLLTDATASIAVVWLAVGVFGVALALATWEWLTDWFDAAPAE